MNDQEQELELMIAAARDAALPTPQQLATGKQRLLDDVGHAVANTDPEQSSVGTEDVNRTAQSALGWKLSAVLAVIATGALTLPWLSQRAALSTTAERAPVPSPIEKRDLKQTAVVTPAPTSGEAPELIVTPRPVAKLSAPRERRHDAAKTAGPKRELPSQGDFAAEVTLLKTAVEAQRQGRVLDARAILDEHVRRYPDSQLDPERKRLATKLQMQ